MARARMFLYTKDVDMRRSFDGLFAIVQEEFRRNLLEGDLFLFLNKRRDRIKLLWWDRDGIAIFAKRLEAGTYQRPVAKEDRVELELDHAALALLLTGIDLSSAKRRKRYRLATTNSAASGPAR
jgi:transposase